MYSIEMGKNAVSSTYGDDGRKLAKNFDKFCLLMWKNFLIQYRHPIQTALEILIPAVFSLILISIRSIISPDVFPNSTMYQPFQINTLAPLRLVSYFLKFFFLILYSIFYLPIQCRKWRLLLLLCVLFLRFRKKMHACLPK